MKKKAVALVSGGKDSVYAIHCARRLGFSIRAVATLLPRENAVETDSYMYQSVGTTLGAAVAECLGVPHYSAHVKGQPINTETLQYTFDPNDEVNDLQLLLERVKEAHPEISAVTCGAILSEYQRRRLEYICESVRLLPVCLMWCREQKGLLRNMLDWGLHAVVVKTASMGLSKRHLGRPLSDLLPHFLELNQQYDFHVCGEGGEYETVTLDCPLFTRGSIAVSDWMQVCHSDDAVAPVWLQSPVEWKVVPKDPTSSRRRARSHAVLHDLEWLRVKPFLDLIDVAVKEWGVEAQNGDSSAPSPLCQTGPDLGSAPPSVGSPSECCEWTWHFPAWSLGYILTGDICVTRSEEGGEAKGGNLSPPNTYWIPLVTERMSTWLDEQLRKTHRSGVRSRIIGAICQACCPDFIGIPENVFEHLGIKPVSLTVVVAPLPRGVKLRLKFVLSSPEGVAVPPTLSLKSLSDDSVVHVHSLNLWVPPCAELDAVHRQGTCCSCQGMRCELASESSFSVSYLLLRGCDGRLPFTCDFPDEVREPNRIPSIWTIEEYRESKPAFYTALQTVNAFISMQYTRHLCYTGGSHRGFPHDDCERFIDEAELGRADSTISQSTHSTAPRALHVTSLLFMAPCIVVFVKLKEGNEEAKTKSDRKLAAVKRLLHLLISRSSHGDEGSLSGDDTESQTILIVAEAPSLPGKARVLMLPMFDISPRQRDRGCSQARAAQHVRQQEEKYTVAVTVVERRLKVRRDPGATVTRGGLHRIRSMAVRLSLQEQLNYTGRYTWEDLVGQLCSTLTHWLKEQSLREGIAILSSDDAEEDSEVATTVGGTKRMLEVCVFYCTSYVHSLQTDSESFEANCRQRIEAGCCESAVASSEFLPIITFFPVLNLAGGVLELVGHTLSAYPK